MIRRILSFIIVLGGCLISSAQIGYQVSLLNNATGEPRANERVTVTVRITDNNGNTVCEETKTETSNDFGVISMTVGDSEIFSNANWNNLPFFIEASVDGRLLGKSQLLSVPVAEHAKHTGTLTKEILKSYTWDDGDSSDSWIEFTDSTVTQYYASGDVRCRFSYIIDGNFVILYNGHDGEGERYNTWGCYYYNGFGLIPVRTP